ncbi:hypothetical protein MPER_08928 [Moniliophthora perniciosa FA553]|nr:hypothetical protein MPER_08928 [Moniliophthora perniciosa FA553]
MLSSFCIQEQPDPPPVEAPPGPPGAIQVFSTSSEDFPAYCAFQDSVAKLFIPSPENPQPLCPHLEMLNIYNNYASDEKLLMQLAESRSASRIKEFVGSGAEAEATLSPMKQFYVSFVHDKKGHDADHMGEVHDEMIMPRIKRLRDEGMKVSMIYPPPYRVSDSPWAGQAPPGFYQEHGTMGAHGGGIHDLMGSMGIPMPMNGNTFMTQFVTGFGVGGPGPGFGPGPALGAGPGPAPGPGPAVGVAAAANGGQGP